MTPRLDPATLRAAIKIAHEVAARAGVVNAAQEHGALCVEAALKKRLREVLETEKTSPPGARQATIGP